MGQDVNCIQPKIKGGKRYVISHRNLEQSDEKRGAAAPLKAMAFFSNESFSRARKD